MRAKPVSGCTYALHLSLPIGQEQAEQAVPFVAAFVRNNWFRHREAACLLWSSVAWPQTVRGGCCGPTGSITYTVPPIVVHGVLVEALSAGRYPGHF